MKASTIVNKALSYVGVTEKYNNNVKMDTFSRRQQKRSMKKQSI